MWRCDWLVMVTLTMTLLHVTGAAHPCDSIQGSFDAWLSQATRIDVVVVGGGAAGLSAAREILVNSTADLVLLEAQDYLGGRVKTYRNSQKGILVEDGAEWINGGKANRLYGLARKLNGLTQPLPDNAYDWRARTWDGKAADPYGYDAAATLFDRCEADGVLVPYYKTGYGQCYKDRFDRVYANNWGKSSEKTGWYHYLHMWVNKDMGTNDWMDMSARDADRFTDWGLDQWNQWADGYDTLINYLREDIPLSKIKKSSPVCKIFWDSPEVPGDEVLVVTKSGPSYLASQVIFTASIGHLKERHLQIFTPALPQAFREALDGTELGIANKVQIGWGSAWWGSDPLNLNIIFPEMEPPAEKSWLYGVMEFLTIHQQPTLLQAFMAGQHAIDMENLPENTVKQHLVEHLKKVTGQAVPEPTFFRRTRWLANPWMRGSYNSFITVEGDKAGLRNRNAFARPLVNSNGKKVLRWAGEHLSNTRYGTVDGAMDIGEIQAYLFLDENPKYWR